MKLTDVIKRPLITEKTTLLREGGRTVVFEVAADATKVDIKRAVEKSGTTHWQQITPARYIYTSQELTVASVFQESP